MKKAWRYLLSPIAASILALSFLSLAASAQVTGRQATAADLGTEGTVEVPSPMLLEISLGASGARRTFADPAVQGRSFYETKKFVCDQATVPFVNVYKKPGERKGGTRLEISPQLRTTYYRQDVDLTVALNSGGKDVRKQFWDDLTIGKDDNLANKLGVWVAAPSSSKRPTASFEFSAEEWAALFANGEAPKVKLILEIQE